jgi:hypothetical protein
MGKHSKDKKGDDKKAHKHHKSSKDKKEKKDKKDRKETKEKSQKHDKKSGGSSSSSSKEHLAPPARAGKANVTEITEEDYFLKSEQFRVYLHIERKTPFETLTSVEARALFKDKFVRDYNKGSLPEMYYDPNGIPADVRDVAMKTKHNWNMKVTKQDKDKIAVLSDDVEHMTRRAVVTDPSKQSAPSSSSSSSLSSSSSSSSSSSLVAQVLSREAAYEASRGQQKNDVRKERERLMTIAEEIAPKEYGRAAQLDKKRSIGDKIHGAARDKEANDFNFSEDFTMGGGDDFRR